MTGQIARALTPIGHCEDRMSTTTARRCVHCTDLLPTGASTRALYCSTTCRDQARNAHRRTVTAWTAEKKRRDALHQPEAAGQLSLDPRPLDALLPALPPMPTRQNGAM